MFPLTYQKNSKCNTRTKQSTTLAKKTKLILNLNTSKDARKRHNMNYETPPKF